MSPIQNENKDLTVIEDLFRFGKLNAFFTVQERRHRGDAANQKAQLTVKKLTK